MVLNSVIHNSVWKLSEEECSEIINLTLIDILSERKDKTFPLNKLVELLNYRTKIYKLSDHKKSNSFSKYLKIKHNGILNYLILTYIDRPKSLLIKQNVDLVFYFS